MTTQNKVSVVPVRGWHCRYDPPGGECSMCAELNRAERARWSEGEFKAALELVEAAVRCIGAFDVPKAKSLHEVELILTPAVGAFLYARGLREDALGLVDLAAPQGLLGR